MKEKLKEIAAKHGIYTERSMPVLEEIYRAGWEARGEREDALLAEVKVYPEERRIVAQLRDAFRSLRMEE